MWVSKAKTTLALYRAVSVAVLLLVFFLPLHFHISSAAQVTQDCSCVHGTRAQLAPPSGSATAAPVLLVTVPAARTEFSWPGDWSVLQNVRAPPGLLSA
jgi:hypothetical protein